MLMFWKELFYTDGYHPREIEDSFVLRGLVFLTITIAIIATVSATESPLWIAGLGVGGSLLGTWISWHRRRAKNWWIKLILALLMLVALASFFGDIGANPYDARVPLAQLLIWLQVLHSFDLPRRKDVFYSLWVALILMSVGATTSRDVSFGFFVLVYALLSVSSLLVSHLSSQQAKQMPSGFWWRLSLPMLVSTGLMAMLLFVAMPRYQGLKFQAFPVSMKIQNQPFFNGQIKNPSYPNQPGSGTGSSSKNRQRNAFDPYAYYGFSTELDLNYRGKLSDEIVMRVRSNQASNWRGMAFDLYDGQRWTMARPDALRRVQSSTLPIWIRESKELQKNIVARTRVTQTFYIEHDQSNLIFKAPYAEQLFFPTDYVFIDTYGSLRSPIELFENTTYTVISDIPYFAPKSLSKISWQQVNEFQGTAELKLDANYFQIPASLPQRVKDLSKQITAGTQSPYEAVLALEAYLRQNYPYNLDIPEFPQNRDTIDYFLFEQKQGYCEHFASSLAIMARSLGLGARFVTGYTSGTYNPMTAYFDVRSSDAHGWVEIYFPHHGWVPFDPTPGYLAPRGQESIFAESQSKHIFDYFKELLPASWRSALEAGITQTLQLLSTIVVGFVGLLTLLPLPVLGSLVVILIAVVLAFVYLLRKPNSKSVEIFQAQYASDPERARFVSSYLSYLLELEQSLTIDYAAELTPQERCENLKPLLSAEQNQNLNQINDYYYELRYSQAAVLKMDLDRHWQILTNLQQAIKSVQTR